MFVSKVDLFIITTEKASDMGVKIAIITMNKIIFIRLIDSYTCGIFFLGNSVFVYNQLYLSNL